MRPKQKKNLRGRPRDENSKNAILKSARELLIKYSLKDITATQLAKNAGVSTATIYRWWPSKEAVLIDGYLSSIENEIAFSQSKNALKSLCDQLSNVVRILSGLEGEMLASIVFCAHSSPELRKTFLERFLYPRREAARQLIEKAILEGDIKKDFKVTVLIDALYGPIYYRLLVKHEPLSQSFIKEHISTVFNGILD